MYTERTQSQRRIEEPRQDLDVGCVVGGMRETLQFYREVREALREENITYLALNVDVEGSSQATIDQFAAYNPTRRDLAILLVAGPPVF